MYYDNIKMWLILGILSLIVYFLGWCHGYNTGKEVGITVGRARAWRQAGEHYRAQFGNFLRLPQSSAVSDNVIPLIKGESNV